MQKSVGAYISAINICVAFHHYSYRPDAHQHSVRVVSFDIFPWEGKHCQSSFLHNNRLYIFKNLVDTFCEREGGVGREGERKRWRERKRCWERKRERERGGEGKFWCTRYFGVSNFRLGTDSKINAGPLEPLPPPPFLPFPALSPASPLLLW